MKTGIVSLILSAVALGAAGFALTRESPPPQRTPERSNRVSTLERKVAELERRLETVAAKPHVVPDAAAEDAVDTPDSPAPKTAGLAAIVDEAVNRKAKEVAAEMRIKANKKPKMETFTGTLKLTTDQKRAAERTVAEGQRKVQEILNIPTADGKNLLDGLVEIAAKGIAQPGKDHGWGVLFGAIMTEKVPGTDRTYGQHIEAVNQSIRDTFKRDWTEEQYKEFQQWGVNPTDIEDVPGSPHAELLQRIMDRARKLGADIPD